jgi:hypothetical protein
VRAKLIFNDKEIAFLRELIRNKVPFMVVGLSAAALQGAPMVTQDVDLWFRNIDHPGIRKALKKFGAVLVPPFGLNPPMFSGENVDCFDIILTVHGIGEFDDEIKTAVEIPVGKLTLKALPISRIIASKVYLNRQKDRMALPALRSAAKSLEKQRAG